MHLRQGVVGAHVAGEHDLDGVGNFLKVMYGIPLPLLEVEEHLSEVGLQHWSVIVSFQERNGPQIGVREVFELAILVVFEKSTPIQ